MSKQCHYLIVRDHGLAIHKVLQDDEHLKVLGIL